MDIATISVPRLALSFIPVAIVIVLMWRWSHRYGRALQAIARMLIQLTLIGYVLVYIFQAESGLIISGVLSIMLVAAELDRTQLAAGLAKGIIISSIPGFSSARRR